MWSDPIKGHYRMDIKSLREAIKGTQFQYLFKGRSNYINHYDQYDYRAGYPLHVIGLMDLYSLHPWVEVLLKNSMENIVIDHLRGGGCRGAICWGAKSIKSAVKRFSKQDMKDVLRCNAGQRRID